MQPNLTALERAFELAKSGKFRRVMDLRRRLCAEGYCARQLGGRVLKIHLQRLMAEAQRAALGSTSTLTSAGTSVASRMATHVIMITRVAGESPKRA
jgi:hypothetical protein